MAEIQMPQLGESVTEGTITKWFKNVGDSVALDEPLFEVSTDKVDSEVPSPQAGVVTEIRVPEGETVDVGTVLVVVSDPAEAQATPPAPEAPAPLAETPPPPVAIVVPQPSPAPEAPAPAPPVPAPPVPAPPVVLVPPSGAESPVDADPGQAGPGEADLGQAGVVLSPLVRRLMVENHIELTDVTGSGLGGRITRDDVLAVIDARASGIVMAPAPQPVSPMPAVPAPPVPPAAVPAPGVPAPEPTPAPPEPTPAPVQAAVVAPAPQAESPPVPAVAPIPAAAPAPAASAQPFDVEQRIPLSNIRLRTGEHMLNSLATSPHAITAIDVDFEAIERARKPLRESFKVDEGFSLTYLPFIARAVVDALAEYPHMNATVGDGELIVHAAVHLSIAVDLAFQGLLAPVVRDADEKRLRAIARDIHDLATRARSKKLVPDDLAGGTFTLSNSGSYGTLLVAPIINQPQVAILSTDGVKRRPVVVELPDGSESIAIHSVGNLTMSWDHRAFDGAYAAAFLQRVKEILETKDWAGEF